MSNYHILQNQINNEKIEIMKRNFPYYVGEYLDSLANEGKSTRTCLSYAYDLSTFFVFLAQQFAINASDVDPVFLNQLRRIDIQHYLSFLKQYRTDDDVEYNKRHPNKPKRYHTNSSKGIARKLATLRGFFDYLVNNSMIDDNPAATARQPVDKHKEDDVLALDNKEVQEVLKGAENGSSLSGREAVFAKKTQYRDMAILELLLGTGLRVSEMVGIDLKDINWDSSPAPSVMVYRKEGKTQRVYMTEEAAGAVKEYIHAERKTVEGEDALFVSPHNGTRLTVRSVERIVKKYTINIAGPEIHTHTMRATYATNLYQNTGDIKLVADALGHKNLATVSKYTRSSEQNRKKAAGEINYHTEAN